MSSEEETEPKWEYVVGKKTLGPCSTTQLKHLLLSRIINPSTMVHKLGAETLTKIQDIEDFAEISKTAHENTKRSILLASAKKHTVLLATVVVVVCIIVWQYTAKKGHDIGSNDAVKSLPQRGIADGLLRNQSLTKRNALNSKEDGHIVHFTESEMQSLGPDYDPKGIKFETKVENIAYWFHNTRLRLIEGATNVTRESSGDGYDLQWRSAQLHYDPTVHQSDIPNLEIDTSINVYNGSAPFLNLKYAPISKQVIQIEINNSVALTVEQKASEDRQMLPYYNEAIIAALNLVCSNDTRSVLGWLGGYPTNLLNNQEYAKVGSFPNCEVFIAQVIENNSDGTTLNIEKSLKQELIIAPKTSKFRLVGMGDWNTCEYWTGYSELLDRSNWGRFYFPANSGVLDPSPNKPANSDIIYSACIVGDLKKLRALTKENPNLFSIKGSYCEMPFAFGKPPLACAVVYGQIETVKFLLANGADINERDKNGCTPLLSALTADKENKAMIALLVANKANVNARDIPTGITPLMCAVNGQQLDIVKLLLQNNADARAAGNKGKTKGVTPLSIAVTLGQTEIVRLLLVNKADANSVDNDDSDMTPLNNAVADGNINITRLLVSYGANINRKDIDGLTALHLAAAAGKVEIVKVLLQNNTADINAKTNKGYTPLRIAMNNGYSDVIELIRAYGGHD